ncbi:histidine phosphatase family protein [Actinoplanes xinjiangensis]|uniref:Broad specificity phosphatase PhoE n=1 Tax=Actinoplanes xinjiangensis TaxID=512350 RepID=A0A316F4H4_9ACTN|nr:histidine phosphatase family protein [Actinoplanes xinjiangensis]PWK40183.1 broad specificity phosphatase PhoE [Actinoplanes xinjiangensis]GIF42498.1 phosphoglycerate mutase [Actinoplanes xinjiangensis]
MNALRLIAAGHTPALRRAVFGGDDPLDEAGRNATRALRDSPTLQARLFPPDDGPWLVAPGHAPRQTAELLGAPGIAETPALAGPDFATWTGRTLDQVDPDGLQQFLTDPAAAPHGGESLLTAGARLAAWLQRQTTTRGTAIAHPLVIRLIAAAALDLPPGNAHRLAIAPLTVTRLTHHHGWTLHL